MNLHHFGNPRQATAGRVYVIVVQTGKAMARWPPGGHRSLFAPADLTRIKLDQPPVPGHSRELLVRRINGGDVFRLAGLKLSFIQKGC